MTLSDGQTLPQERRVMNEKLPNEKYQQTSQESNGTETQIWEKWAEDHTVNGL